MLQKHMSTF